MNDAALLALLRRDRWIVLAALAGIAVLAWIYILRLAAGMQMGGMDMTGYRMTVDRLQMIMAPATDPWDWPEFGFTLAMWAVMMIGMMTPSAAPMILIYARVGRQAAMQGKPLAATGWFAVGYLLAWCAFAVAATSAQWALQRASLLTPTMASASTVLGGLLLAAAGLYQWTPLKDACLRQCQFPLAFIQRRGGFRRDACGSLSLGFLHGGYCVGCCWALMALLFVGGVMNLLWIALLALLVLAEKLLPAGRLLARI